MGQTYSSESLQGLREYQQDNWRVVKHPEGKWLLVVADGMGGLEDGESASRIAVETIVEQNPQNMEELKSAFYQAQSAVAYDSHYSGTTLVVAVIEEDKAYVCGLGDSRVYLLRADKLTRLTTDHNLYGAKIRNAENRGKVFNNGVDDPNNRPGSNILTEFIGGEVRGVIRPRCTEHELEAGDRIILGTDGLWDVWNDATLLEKLKESDFHAETICEKAVGEGSTDNTTAVILEM